MGANHVSSVPLSWLDVLARCLSRVTCCVGLVGGGGGVWMVVHSLQEVSFLTDLKPQEKAFVPQRAGWSSITHTIESPPSPLSYGLHHTATTMQ